MSKIIRTDSTQKHKPIPLYLYSLSKMSQLWFCKLQKEKKIMSLFLLSELLSGCFRFWLRQPDVKAAGSPSLSPAATSIHPTQVVVPLCWAKTTNRSRKKGGEKKMKAWLWGEGRQMKAKAAAVQSTNAQWRITCRPVSQTHKQLIYQIIILSHTGEEVLGTSTY